MGRSVKSFRNAVRETSTLGARALRLTRGSCAPGHFRDENALVAAAAAGAGTAGTAAVGSGQGHFGFHRKAHIGQINFYALHLVQKILIDAERKAALFLGLILIVRLIQSQCETRAASAARGIYPYGSFFLVRKISPKLFAGGIRKFDHVTSRV